ncbi:hypothetical protein ACTXN9_13065 [Corynebacterium casei]|uniref:hypothetical protein n=1 Tax=Corynebacterium casei TaxID=160386 RepID=UPI003FD2036A
MTAIKSSGNLNSSSTGRGDDALSDFARPTRLVAFFRRLPTTTLVLAPYLLLFLPPAFIFGNSSVWFLIKVALIALLATTLVDLFWPRTPQMQDPKAILKRYDRRLFHFAFIVVAFSSLVRFLAALAGKGSVAVQTGRAEMSSGYIGTLDSLIGSWGIAGVGLAVAAYFGGYCSKKELFLTVGIGVAGTALGVVFTQITAPLFSEITFLTMFLLFFGLIRSRLILIGIVVVLYIWPTIFEIRNQWRVESGVRVSDEVSAFDRLRFDLQFARAQELSVPLEDTAIGFLQNPNVLDILRYGIIPRFLDPDRDLVSTGQVINMALGGSETSAYTFGPVTTIYVLGGSLYLFFYYALLAVLVNWVWKNGALITPVRLLLLATLFSGPLGWFSTQPDTLIGAVQDVTASVPLFIGLYLIRRKSERH